MSVLYVDESNFESEVVNSSVLVLVDFGASWCGPCQRQMPIVEKFALENVGVVKVCQVDIDESPHIASKFSIRSVPSLVVFNNGQKVGMKVGLTDTTSLQNFVSQIKNK